MGYLPEQVRGLRWYDERLLIEGLVDEGVIEASEESNDLDSLEALGVTVRRDG